MVSDRARENTFVVAHYLTAIVAVMMSAVLRQLLDPILATESPMLAFVVGVAIAALIGGRGPGLAATALSLVVGDYLFIEPRFQIGLSSLLEWVRLALFTFEGLVITLAVGLLQDYTRRLEHDVKRRTAELEESNDALETFAHTISHDLRAPLRTIRGLAEIIEADYGRYVPEDGREFMRRISAAAHRLETLVTNLLAYTRVVRTEAARESVSLDRTMEQVLHAVGDELSQSGGRVDIEAPLGEVIATPEVIELVLVNLVSNALKFVAAGRKPYVRVRSDRSNGIRRVVVQDNGIGVEPGFAERVFEPFERLHSRGQYPGSGLGLALVKRGVIGMGGRCGVISDGASGSEFWIELPIPPGETSPGPTDTAR